MKSIRTITASSALILALAIASPALAHSSKGDDADKYHRFAVNVGGILKVDRDGDKEKSEKDRGGHVASIEGTVAGLSGATLTINGEQGAVYSVNASGATINGSSDAAMLAKIQVGDRIKVKGTVSGTMVIATKITDKSLKSREMLVDLNGVRAGVVTAVNGNIITINRFGTGTTTVNTSASTFFAAGGTATTSAAIKAGTNIVVFGPTTTGVNDSISASVVLVLTHSVDFLKHLFR